MLASDVHFAPSAVTPALYHIEEDIPMELLKILPSMALLLTAPCIPAMIAALLPTPSLAIFRAKRQLKFVIRCVNALVQSVSIGFANQDASVTDMTQILDQLDSSLTAISSMHSAVVAELLVFQGDMLFADQLKEFVSIMREVHGMLLGLSQSIRDIHPTKTHQLFFTFLDKPLQELGEAIMHMLWYTYSSMRQPHLHPFGAYNSNRHNGETPWEWVSWAKGIMFGETAPVPELPLELDNEPFEEVFRCVKRLQQVYSEARVQIIYGVVFDDAETDKLKEVDMDDLIDETRVSRLVSIDQVVMQETE